MRKFLLFLTIVLLSPAVVMAQQHKQKTKKADAETVEWKYELAPVAVGAQGNVIVKVWSYSANPNVAAEQAKKNAVHGVIFKGVPSAVNIPGKKPLVIEPEARSTYATDYFNDFFAQGGDYMRFVTLSGSGEQDVSKVDRRRYKVGVVVVVSYDNLRKELERAGIVKGLNSGF